MQPLINWAHRGASGHAPENTLSAFRLAIEMGADGIECDLRESQDGEVIVFHDPTLKRIAGRSEFIHQLPILELKKINIGIGFSAADRKERIPTLSELITEIKPPFLLNLEMKRATPQRVLDTVYRHNAKDRVLISSFDLDTLTQLRSLDSDIAIGYLVDRNVTPTHLKEAEKIKAKSLHLSVRGATTDMIQRVHHNGFLVYPYTVDKTNQMVRFVKMGADGLFTNYPDRLSQLILKLKEMRC